MKIIAECCQNHNGETALLLEMLQVAADCGATHVKMQSIFSRNLTYRPEFEEGYRDINGNAQIVRRPYLDELERLSGLEIDWSDQRRFVMAAERVGVIPLTTCFSHDTMDIIEQCGFTEIKIASYDCPSYYLINRAIKKFEHTYISTGATFDSEIAYLASFVGSQTTLLHCVTQYPLVVNNANISRMNWLRNFSEKVGYSDHSANQLERPSLPLMLAVALKADVVEAHFTILRPEDTRDGPVSIGPQALRYLCDYSRLSTDRQFAELKELYPDWEEAIGDANRKMSREELLNRQYYKGRFSSPRQDYGPDCIGSTIMNWEPWSE